MVRLALMLVFLAAPLWAHGGAFRPPPRPLAGDKYKPHIRPAVVTARTNVANPILEWEYWWRLNRERFLRLRERMHKRTVISGGPRGEGSFNRKDVRDKALLPVMLRAMDSPHEEIRTSAAVALGKLRSERARPALLDALSSDRSKQVREAAMLGLVLMRDPGLNEVFRRFVSDGQAPRRLRVFAVLGLGFLKDGASLRSLLSGRSKLGGAISTVDEMRAAAALALGFADGVAPLLTSAIDGGAPQSVRGYAGSGLARLGNPLAEPEMLKLVFDKGSNHLARYGAAIALGTIIGKSRETLIDKLGRLATRDRDRRVRALMILSLGRIGGDRAATHIVAAKRTYTRNTGFLYLALGMSRANGAGDVLFSMFRRIKNAQDRGACALGLAIAGHKKAARALREQVKRGNPVFLPHGMVALGMLDDPKAIPLVREILKKNRDPIVRREGAIALALLRRAGAIPELVDLLKKSKSLFVRGAVAAALGQIGNMAAVNPLLEIYRNRKLQPEERAIALAALGRIGDLDDIPLFARLAFDLNPYVVSDAISEVLTIL